MRLKWKYTLIINLSVLIILAAFYVLDDIRARKDLTELHANGVKRGAIFKEIAEVNIRRTVQEEIERWQAFTPEEIEKALVNHLKTQGLMQSIVDIDVTLGEDNRIWASLTPNKDKETHLQLTDEDRAEIEQNGVKIYDTPPVNGKYTTGVIIPYRASVISREDWLLMFTVFHTDLAYETALNGGTIPDGLREAFQAHNRPLSEEAQVTIKKRMNNHYWQITDGQQSYFVWKYRDQLVITTDRAPPPVPPGEPKGYIRVLFDVPDITRSIQWSRLMHLIFVVVVSALLVVIIDMTTTRLIMQPLERMLEIIRHAEAGKLDSLPQSYSSGEIGRVTSSLVRMLKQLQQSHSKRIAALGQFAAGVAHEIRNPLNTIGMTAQHLKSRFSNEKAVKPEDIAEARELLDIVNYEIEMLRRVSEQFLTLNRPKQLKLEPTDLNALLDRVLSEFTLTMEKAKVKAIREYAANLPTLELDRNLIRQAIFNLIQNSIQAMPKGGGRIYVSTGVEETGAGKGVTMEIRDTGIGIPEEIQERIFDAYFTTKESEGGMGLGLAITHQIITAHKGKIEMKSKVGMGTVFEICFPMPN